MPFAVEWPLIIKSHASILFAVQWKLATKCISHSCLFQIIGSLLLRVNQSCMAFVVEWKLIIKSESVVHALLQLIGSYLLRVNQ